MPSSSLEKLFVYTDEQSERVLLTKRSQGPDFFLPIDGVRNSCVQTPEPLSPLVKFETTFSVLGGIKIVGAPPPEMRPRLEVLRKKCEIGLFMATTLFFVQEEMKTVFSPQAVRSYPIRRDLFPLYENFMAGEKRLLKKKIETFRAEFFGRLNQLMTLQELDDYHQDLRFNLNIGVYSVTNRERKKIGNPQI